MSLETIKLNAQMHTDNIIISYFYPYPQTKILEIAEQAGFIDVTISPDDPVRLRMPQYKRSDLIYFRYSFLKFIRKYRKVYKSLSGEKLDKEINRLDSIILGEKHPRKLIGIIRRRTYRATVALKRIASLYLPAVYKMLKGVRDKKASKG